MSDHRTITEAHPFHGFIVNRASGQMRPPELEVVLGPEYLAWANQFPGPIGDPERVEMHDPNCPFCRAVRGEA